MTRITELQVEERRAFISEHLGRNFEVRYFNGRCYLYLRGQILTSGTKREVFEGMRLIYIGSAFVSNISIPILQ